MPSTFAEKTAFKNSIKESCRFVVAENFDEAIQNVQECYRNDSVLNANI